MSRFPKLVMARGATPIIVGGLAIVAGACRSAAPATATAGATSPRSTIGAAVPAMLAQQLLEADRTWSKHAGSGTFPSALGAMFHPTVRMPVRDQILVGSGAVLSAFAASPDTGGTVSWTPVRVGISADAQHGFTAGVQFVTRRDGTRSAARYLAYWVRADDQRWRVVAWRRRPLEGVTPGTTVQPAMLPDDMVPPVTKATTLASHLRGLIAAEQGFSDEANRIGVGAAFAKLGDERAIDMGRPQDAAFVQGPDAIAALVSGGQPLDAPSTIAWRADTALVASSGDLGITFGVIRPKSPLTGQPNAGASFFTIWRRASPTAPWRYVAE